MPLFRYGTFTSAAGAALDWKIECDALTDEDWACIAEVGRAALPAYGGVYAVPRGGLPLANHMARWRDSRLSTALVVDDVWTTGHSMRFIAKQYGLVNWIGFVAFARGPLDDNVTAFMRSLSCPRT